MRIKNNGQDNFYKKIKREGKSLVEQKNDLFINTIIIIIIIIVNILIRMSKM